jgi:hypothetical protein
VGVGRGPADAASADDLAALSTTLTSLFHNTAPTTAAKTAGKTTGKASEKTSEKTTGKTSTKTTGPTHHAMLDDVKLEILLPGDGAIVLASRKGVPIPKPVVETPPLLPAATVDGPTQEEEQAVEEEEGMICEIVAMATLYSRHTILVRAITGHDDNPLLPRRIVAERIVNVNVLRSRVKAWALHKESDGDTIVPLAGTRTGAIAHAHANAHANTSNGVSTTAPTSPVGRNEPTTPVATSPPHASSHASPHTLDRKTLSMVGGKAFSRAGSRAWKVTDASARTPARNPAPPPSRASPAGTLPPSPDEWTMSLVQLADRMLAATLLQLVGEEDILAITLPGDSLGESARLRDSLGSPYKSRDRYMSNDTPGFNRQGTFLLLRRAMSLRVVVQSPPLLKGNEPQSTKRRSVGNSSSMGNLSPPPVTRPLTDAQIAAAIQQFSSFLRQLAVPRVLQTGVATIDPHPTAVLLSVHSIQEAKRKGKEKETTLVASVVAANSSFALTHIPLPIKLTSAMLLDTQLAEEFVESFAPSLTLHVPYSWDGSSHDVRFALP